MSNFGKIIAALCMAASLLACQGNARHGELAAIDSLCEENPDSALAVLRGMAGEAVNLGRSDRHYYGLLCIKAGDKCYEEQESDSLIRVLVDYYEHHDGQDLLAQAYYYAGRCYFEQFNAPQALHYFHLAQRLAAKLGKKDLESRVCSQMGYLFHYQELQEDAARCFRQSLALDEAIGDTVGMIYGLRDLGSVLGDQEDFAGEEQMLLRADSLARAAGQERMHLSVSHYLSIHYSETGDWQRAKQWAQEPLAQAEEINPGGIYSNLSRIYFALGELDSAAHYCRLVQQVGGLNTKEHAYKRLTLIGLRKGSLADAQQSFEQYLAYEDSARMLMQTEALAKAEALYNYERKEKENLQLRQAQQRQRFFVFAAGLTAMLLAGWAFFLLRDRRRQRELYESRLNQMESMAAVARFEMDEREKQWKQVRESDTYAKILGYIDQNKPLPQGFWPEVEALVESGCEHFRLKLERLCKISDMEYRVCLLLKLGFEPMKISVLTARARNSISMLRKRLYLKAFGQEGTAEEWDKVVNNL